MIQRAGRRCRNELRHASCSYFEDFRFAGQHAQRGENHTSRRAPKGANVSHEHKSCGQHKHLHDTRDDEDRGGAIDEDFSSPAAPNPWHCISHHGPRLSTHVHVLARIAVVFRRSQTHGADLQYTQRTYLPTREQ